MISEEQLNKWHDQADTMAISKTAPYAGVGRIWVQLIAEVRRLQGEVRITEDLYRSAHTKYQRCAKALEFYAKPIHWMGPTEDAEIQNVLVAMQGEDSNGWGPAREALNYD